MGVKETPISDTADTADEDEENGEEEQSEETPPEDSKQEEAPEDKPKRAKAKPEAKKKAEAKPAAKKKAEAKPEEQPEEMPKPAAKRKAKKETEDLKQKTMCSICKSEPISTDALLYTHSCKKEALAKRKTAPLFDEVAAPPKAPQGKIPWQSGEAVPRQPSLGDPPESQPPPSYREILARQQQEMRWQKAARIVNPIRAHFFGYAL